VNLRAPISRYVPEFRPRYRVEGTRQPMVLDLATHTAGLTRDMIGPKASGRYHVYTEQELFDWLRTQAMAVPPGLQCKYSNYGYAVMGSVLERATKRPYRDLVRERVLTPLGMAHSGFGELRAQPALAIPYSKQGDGRAPFTDVAWDFGAQAAASELISSVEDMAWFAQAHLAQPPGPVASAPVRATLFARYFPTGGEGAAGLGWWCGLTGGIPTWSHGGSVNDFNSVLILRPDVGLGLVLAANGEAPLEDLAARLLRLMAPSADTSALDPWVGDYVHPGGARAMIRRNEHAVLTLEVHGAVRMAPIGPATYRVTEGLNTGEWVRFVVESGKPVMIWESARWESARWERVP
jgi:CubicO group peptidase (beta-lactamase class C family)